MPLIVHTAAHGSIDDPDELIISRKLNETIRADGWPDGHRGVGIHFCPSKGIQAARYRRCLFKLEHEHPDEWELYRTGYINEMRQSYRRQRKAWDEVLGWQRVVIVSRADDAGWERSPRTVLARDILTKLGATYAGELGLGQ